MSRESLPKLPVEPESKKKLFGHRFSIEHLTNGDLLPVGGKGFQSVANINVITDFDNLQVQEFLSAASELAEKYNPEKLQVWLTTIGLTISTHLFARLFAFTKIYQTKFPHHSDRETIRRQMYQDKRGELKISQVFAAGAAECAEIAALAQFFLQQEHYQSTYISGDIMRKKESEFSSEHSFLVVASADQSYIFDPTNPITSGDEILPSIYTTTGDFLSTISQDKKCFVSATNFWNKKIAYFGVNNGTAVDPDRHIV